MLVTIQRTCAVEIWHLLTNGEVFKELGTEYSDEHNKDRAKFRAGRELEPCGFEVHLDAAA